MSYTDTAVLVLVCCGAVLFIFVTTVGSIVARYWGEDDD